MVAGAVAMVAGAVVGVAKVDAAKVDAAKVGATVIEATAVKGMSVEATGVETAGIEAADVEAVNAAADMVGVLARAVVVAVFRAARFWFTSMLTVSDATIGWATELARSTWTPAAAVVETSVVEAAGLRPCAIEHQAGLVTVSGVQADVIVVRVASALDDEVSAASSLPSPSSVSSSEEEVVSEISRKVGGLVPKMACRVL